MNQARRKKAPEAGHSAAAGAAPRPPRETVHAHFHRLRFRITLAIIIAFVTPIFLLFLYFEFQLNHTLKMSGKQHLLALAESQRNTMDLFLQERVLNLFGLFYRDDFTLTPDESRMMTYLQSLLRASGAFIDLGFFTSEGRHVGYAGRFPFLAEIDYSGETWFKTLMAQDRNYYISDIYQGFRNQPHFTIAVKQTIADRVIVIRATLDPDKFGVVLRNISRGKGVESFVLDEQGRYQIVDPEEGTLSDKSDYSPSGDAESGVEEVTRGGAVALVAYARLKETPWVLAVRQPLNVAYAKMYRARSIMVLATAVVILLVIGVALAATRAVLREAEATAESRDELRYQLMHASKLASVGELAAGVAHEINNPLAIIVGSSGVIRDYLDPELGLKHDSTTIMAELETIDNAAFRARDITRKLLHFARIHEPRLVPTNVNKVLEAVLGGLKEREFSVANIRLVRQFEEDLPRVMVDPDQITQAFLNLINNAGDAIEGSGTITVTTRRHGDFVHVSVSDTGTGMTPEVMAKIFLPFYTTKEAGKGTGLGLPLTLSIVESLGGRLEVQSLPGAGSSFIIVLPIGMPADAPATDQAASAGGGPERGADDGRERDGTKNQPVAGR